MPLIAWLVIAYIAGLLAGFGGMPAFVALLLGGLAIVAAAQGRMVIVATLAFLAAGIASALSAKHGNDECVRRSAGATVVVARLERSIEPGGFSPATLTGCSARLSVFAA